MAQQQESLITNMSKFRSHTPHSHLAGCESSKEGGNLVRNSSKGADSPGAETTATATATTAERRDIDGTRSHEQKELLAAAAATVLRKQLGLLASFMFDLNNGPTKNHRPRSKDTALYPSLRF